jgi:hypothetical protein
MKKLLMITILGIGIFSSSCEKDDECFAPTVSGTYIGTKECDDKAPENVTFQVAIGASDIQLIIDDIPTVIEDCDIFGSTVIQGYGREIDGDIDGNEIHFIETIKVNGSVAFRCLWKGVKN